MMMVTRLANGPLRRSRSQGLRLVPEIVGLVSEIFFHGKPQYVAGTLQMPLYYRPAATAFGRRSF